MYIVDRAKWFELASLDGKVKRSRFNILRDALGLLPIVVSGKAVIIADTEENRTEIEIYEAHGKKDAPTFFRLKVKGGTFADSRKIEKTPMFGGTFGADRSPGSKLAPTESTARAESLQCFYNAAVAKNPRLKFNDASQAHLNDFATKCFTGSTTLAKAYDMDQSWHQSAYWIAQALVKDKYINSGYTYHRDDSIMKSIYAVKDKTYTKDKLPILSDDKWNPGDFWAIKKGVSVLTAFDGYDTSTLALNKRLQVLFDGKDIIAISLKKVSKENKLKIKRINHANDPRQIKQHKLSHVELAGKKGFFSAKQAYVYTSNNPSIKAIMADRSGRTGAQNIEIVLIGAKGGGAGFDKALIPAAEKHLGTHNIANNTTAKLITAAIMQGDDITIDKFWKMVETVQKSPLCQDKRNDIVTEEQFKEQLKHKDTTDDRVHSKYAQASILNALVKARKPDRDKWIDWVINYAGSTLAESSVYLKAFQEE